MGAVEEVIMPYEKVNVKCYSGYRANERPVVFTYRKRRGKWRKSSTDGTREVWRPKILM